MTHQPRTRPQSQRVLAMVAVSLLLAGCGPETQVDVGVKAAPVNVAFGGKDPAAAPRPPQVPYTGPGVLSPAQRLDRPAPGAPSTPPQATPFPPVITPTEECPKAGAGAPVEEAAPSVVAKGPVPGSYRYRRSGVLQVGASGQTEEEVLSRPRQQVAPLVVQQVTNVTQTPVPQMGTRVTWDVVALEPGLRTTTSYLVDPVGSSAADPRASAGLKITKIVIQRTDLPKGGPAGAAGEEDMEVFEPQPPIKIMNLPAGGEPPPDVNTYSTGADPQTAATMKVFSAVQGRATVDACGTLIQGWRVHVSFADDGTGSRASTYDRPAVRGYRFEGDFVFAPQYCLFLSEDLVVTGTDVGGVPYRLATSSAINDVGVR